MNEIFEDLFVLEMTNNHRGNLDRALKMVDQFAKVARFNGVRAAIKVQFRDVNTFVHEKYRQCMGIKYIRRITETQMSKSDYETIIKSIRGHGCIPMATPFDESSVDWCVEFGLPIIKVASADGNDWLLLEKIASTRKPVIVSVGGVSAKDMDDMVLFFEHRNIPLGINHCVTAYPHEFHECELNQIDFLKNRFPGHVIGFSTHERGPEVQSIGLAYAKGARMFEKHIDIGPEKDAAEYSAMPEHIDAWFKEWHKARQMCGADGRYRKSPGKKEIDYLDSYVRGAYAKRDLQPGNKLTEDDIYMAIPLQRGQLSSRELMLGKFGHTITQFCQAGNPVTASVIGVDEHVAKELNRRGI